MTELTDRLHHATAFSSVFRRRETTHLFSAVAQEFWRSCDNDEYPVPKSSIAILKPVATNWRQMSELTGIVGQRNRFRDFQNQILWMQLAAPELFDQHRDKIRRKQLAAGNIDHCAVAAVPPRAIARVASAPAR